MAQTVDIPTQLIIEHGAIDHLHRTDIYGWLEGRKIALISGTGETRKFTERIKEAVLPQAKDVQLLPAQDNALETINAIEREVLEAGSDMIIGVGGGRALDVAKVVGTRSNVTVLLMPTAVSNDAICSPVAVIKMSKRTSIGVHMPSAVIVDLDVLASSPERLVRAGIGDLISNRTALYDWDLAHRADQGKMYTFARLMANNAIEAFMNTIKSASLTETELLRALTESLVMSGIAMSVAGSSRPCSGSEHLISHALDYYCGGKALHGEQVAIGVLIAEYLQGRHHSEDNLRQYYKKLGLPLHYEQLGYTREEMWEAIRRAPTMRNRYTILNEYALTDAQIEQILTDVFPDESRLN
ncbi:iron-containing alcohol dehydrogenase family protein [Numidum massiliense]|uniref:iron-containing alcohol dehydrogenase family protein n=1 Tax=Numidum massiliense TaxID=1522315 RepID=UPI0006D55638|nr:iron-containing alcohol dehydrogenase family protein [Numidum massiliense]